MDTQEPSKEASQTSGQSPRAPQSAIFAMNLLGQIQDVNQAAAEMIGYLPEELRAMRFGDLLLTGELPWQENGELRWADVAAQGVWLRHKEGSPIPVELGCSPLQLGQQQVIIVTAKHATVLQQVDRPLQETLDQLQLAIDTAKLGIWQLNVETGHLTWNDQQLQIYGVSREEFQTDLDGWRAQIHPEDTVYTDSRLAEVFQGKSVYNVEFRLIRPNGEIRHIDASASPVYDQAQKLIGLIGINVDVTTVKQNEARLRERELFLQAIFDNSLNAIMVVDDVGNYVAVNPAAADMFGYPIDQLNRMNVADLRTARGPDAAARYKHYLKSGLEIGEFEFTRTDGEIRIAQYHATRIAKNLHVSIMADITEQKRAEQELRTSEARFRALFSAIPVPTYAWQRIAGDFILVDYNEIALAATEGQVVNLIGSRASDLYKQDPGILEELEQCFQQKSIIQREMVYTFRTTGKIKTVNVTYAYVPDDMILVQAEDVSEQRQIEVTLREQEQRLELVLKGADLGYWDWNIQTGEVAFNERWAEMLGYTLSEVKPHVDSWSQSLHPDEASMVLDALNRHLRGETPFYETEHRMLTKDGASCWVLDRGKVLTWDEKGNPLRAAGTLLDITRRKQIEQALIESEQRFRALMEQSPLPTAIFAPDGTLLDANPAMQNLWRLPNDAAKVFGSYNALTSQRHIDLGIDEYVKRAFAGESVLIPVYESDAGRSLREFGVDIDKTEKRWLRSHYYPIKDSNGTLTNVVLVHEDVTEQKRADDSLQKAQERFEKAFFHSPVAMNILNFRTGERLEFNERFLALAGYSREEIASSTVASLNRFVNPEERTLAITTLLEKGELYNYPARISTKQGEIRDVLIYANMMNGVEEGIALLSWIDMTDLNRTQETLRQLSQAIEQSPVSVVITDLNGTIEYVNPKFCQVTGYSAEEVLGQTPRILKSSAHSPALYRQMWETISGGHIWRGELQNKKKNGEVYWERASIASVKDQDGVITHYVAVKEDITEQRRVEEAQASQERLAAIGQMAAGIAHDFNNILGVIVIYAQMLSRAQDLPRQIQEKAAIIHQQAIHASNLVQQILDFSRRSNLEKQPFNLLPLLKEQVKLLTRTLPEDITLSLGYSDEEYMLNADPTRMQQIITNLAINARDAMPNGGTLHMSLSNVNFDETDPLPVVSMAPGKWLRLSVADTGTGMSAEVLEHIFEPFFTTKERGRGTGLGLAQVYGIVKQHDGYVEVTSSVDAGTTFDIYLPPLLQQHNTRLMLDDVPHLPQGAGQHILVVEDEAELRLVLAELLTSWNYNSLTAQNGLEAQQILAEEKETIDLVVTDFIMPHMGGAQLLAHIQENYPEIPVLVISGHLDIDRTVTFENLGLKKWLPKPLNIPTFAQVIADLLSDKLSAVAPMSGLDR